MTNRPPRSGAPGGSELSWDELISGGEPDPAPTGGDAASDSSGGFAPPTGPPSGRLHLGPSTGGHDRHARRSRVRTPAVPPGPPGPAGPPEEGPPAVAGSASPAVLDLRAQTPVGGMTPETVTAEHVLDLGSTTATTRTRPAPATPAPAVPAAPEPPQRAEAHEVADEQRELEERVAQVLRSPETLRGVHQPIVDLHTGDCVGYEAFVRIADWPARSPRPWFDAAARVGLAAQLEAAALATSLRARLTMPGDRLLAVNLSTGSLVDDNVLRVLDDEEDLTRLVLTPSPAREALPPADASAAIAALRSRGLLLGTKVREAGRSDLHVLDALRPDLVVLTREFGVDVHESPSRQRLLRTVVELAAETGAAVLATGIESVADARCLQRLGVHLGQGWLFGRPRPGFLPPPAGTDEWVREVAARNAAEARAEARAEAGEPVDEADEGSPGVPAADDALDDRVIRQVAAANAATTPPGIPLTPAPPVPRPRPAENGAGRHTAEHPTVP